MSFTAKDVQALRQATGAGMMDAKRALEATDGDAEAAAQWLREKGLAKAAERSERDNTQGAVAAVRRRQRRQHRAAQVRDRLRRLVRALQEPGRPTWPPWWRPRASTPTAERAKEIEDLRLTLKEHIELGEVVRIEADAGNVARLLPARPGRAGRQRRARRAGRRHPQLAHDIAVHIAFARPKYLCRDDVPADVVEKERATLEAITRNEGKPEQAIRKIVEGRLNGFFKEICLLEQPYAKDDKLSISQLLGGGTVVRFAQVEIG